MKNDDNPWQTLDSRIVYQNPWMKVYEDRVVMPSGAKGIYGFIDGKPGVFIIALTETGEIYIIESFRYPIKKWQWELPSGGIEPGAILLETARNELAEELGITADKWTHINRNVPAHNGLMCDATDVFVAEGLRTGKEHREESEAIRDVKAIPFEEIITMINDGRLADGQTLAALMQFVAWQKSHSGIQ